MSSTPPSPRYPSDLGGWVRYFQLVEIPVQGRGSGGVRLTRLKPEDRAVRYAVVALPAELSVVVGQDGAPDRPDPNPIGLALEPTRRDGPGAPLDRPILAAGKARW